MKYKNSVLKARILLVYCGICDYSNVIRLQDGAFLMLSNQNVLNSIQW